jgi:hypothetical protein
MPKVMIIIFSSPLGFPVIGALPGGDRFPAPYLCDNMMPQIAEQGQSDARRKGGGKSVRQQGNATPHRAKLTKSCFKTFRLREAGQPPYSPHLAASDFCLFLKLKGQMSQNELESREDLLPMIR